SSSSSKGGSTRTMPRFSFGGRCAPIKEFHERLQALDIPKMLCAELDVRSDRGITGLTGSGLVIVNPPFTLKDELHQLLP
ncbi:23S rRNA (adenine(2030)-N(6))-methyltransferase RlmJ, partial [Rhizobium leguminosarum]|uniref:23S rRNA (adenine(2030)-N(6))-methyltransferase RlmJ n=1 Tax=Rhizobium leguminosarum TaxID=384 RepID=UPI003F95DCD7